MLATFKTAALLGLPALASHVMGHYVFNISFSDINEIEFWSMTTTSSADYFMDILTIPGDHGDVLRIGEISGADGFATVKWAPAFSFYKGTEYWLEVSARSVVKGGPGPAFGNNFEVVLFNKDGGVVEAHQMEGKGVVDNGDGWFRGWWTIVPSGNERNGDWYLGFHVRPTGMEVDWQIDDCTLYEWK